MYQLGDVIKTTKGTLFVQCGIVFQKNTNPKYDKLGGSVLFWCHDESGEDVFYWGRELKEIFVSDVRVASDEVLDEEVN